MIGEERRSTAKQPRRLLCFSAAFCLPCLIFALTYSQAWPRALLITAVSAVAAGIVLLLCLRSRAYTLTAGLLCGVLWIALFWGFILLPAERWQGKSAEITVELTEPAVGRASYGTAEGRLLSLNGRRAFGRIFVYLKDGSPEYNPGDCITFIGNLRPSNHLSDGLFRAARQEGPVTVDAYASPGLRARMRIWSQVLGGQIDRLLDGDEGALFKAIICGDKSGMSRDFRSALSVSGLSHIAAVSGMHLSVLVGFCCAFLGKRRGSAVAIPIIILYAGLTGLSPSVLRAAIMTLIAIAAFFLRRESDPLTSLFAALMILAAVNPFSLLSPSLLLSFSATLGILLFAPTLSAAVPLPDKDNRLRKPVKMLVDSAAVSVSATLCAAPVTMLFFSRVSLLAVLSGLLVLWAVSAAMVLGIAILALSAAWMQGALLFARWLLRPLLLYITTVVHVLGGNPALTVAADSPYLPVVLLVLLGLLVLLRQKKKIAGLLPATAGLLIACVVLSGAEQMLLTRVSIIDAGSSAIVLLDSRGKSYAVNCGLSAAGRNARLVEDALYARGRSGLEDMLITSPAVRAGGGLETLCQSVEIGRSIAPCGSAAARYADGVWEQSGSLSWGAAHAELIALSTDAAAVRILLPHFSLLDLTQVSPIDYVTCTYGGELGGDVVIIRENFLRDAPALELLVRSTGCRAIICADSGYATLPSDGVCGIPLYSLAQQENIQITTRNW